MLTWLSKVSNKTKIVLIGDSRVGKTSLRRQYMGDSFRGTYSATMGSEFSVKKLKDNIITIYDLAGDPKSKIFRMQYYPGTQGVLMVFDVNYRKSFENIRVWIDEIRENIKSQLVIFILGNKIDLFDNSLDPVTEVQAYKLSKELEEELGCSVSYLSTSALTGHNVDVAFSKILAEIQFRY